MRSDLVIRPLGQQDRALILSSNAFDGPAHKSNTDDFLKDLRHLIVGAIIGDELIGFASGVVQLHPDKTPTLFVSEVGVNESYQREGIATRLVTALIDLGRVQGCVGVWVATEDDNIPARRLYDRLGGRETQGIVVYDWGGVMDDG